MPDLSMILSRGLAAAFLDGPWVLIGLVERGNQCLGHRHRSLRRIALAVMKEFPNPPLGRRDALAAFIHEQRKLPRAFVRHWHLPVPSMAEALPFVAHLTLPSLASHEDLASWLDVDQLRLAWFADEHRHLRSAVGSRLRHYHRKWIPKRSGAYRLLESPKSRLKEIQRRILREILDSLPLHEAAHGFRRGRSILSNAEPHIGKDVVVRLDLAEFFSAISEARVRALFASLGYPDGIARTLAALCCAPTPREVLQAAPRPIDDPIARREHHFQRRLLSASHLPQGAPTSPSLANLIAFRLDCRLAGLAAQWGADYTRYADDLCFSGDKRLASRASTLIGTVAAIAQDEGFAVRLRKTRVMRKSARQQVTGIVTNVRPNLSREEIKGLEAILFNCVRYGPESQNRLGHRDFHAHLAGRVSWVEQAATPSRARRLRDLFEQIEW